MPEARTRRQMALTTAGLMCLWPCMHMSLYSPLSFLESLGITRAEAAQLFTMYAVSVLILFSIVLLLQRLMPARFDRLSEKHGLKGLLSTVCCLLGVACCIGAQFNLLMPDVLFRCGVLLLAAWMLLVFVGWFRTMSSFAPDDIVRMVFSSYALYLLLCAVVTQSGNDIVLAVYLVASAVLAAVLLCFAARPVGAECDNISNHSASSPKGSISALFEGVAVPGLLFILFGQVIPSFMANPSEESALYSNKIITLGLTLLVVIVMLVWVTTHHWNSEMSISMFAFISVAIAIGFFLALFFSERYLEIYKHFIIAGIHTLFLYMFAYFVIECRSRKTPPDISGSVFYILYALLPCLIPNIVRALFPTSIFTFETYVTTALLSFGILVILSVTVFVIMRHGERERRKANEVQERLISSACDKVASAWMLSERERDVMEQIGLGNDVTRTADELGIAESTVKTHLRHIYEKLDVHSRKELADFIQAHIS